MKALNPVAFLSEFVASKAVLECHGIAPRGTSLANSALRTSTR
jgi:hypothetical protein